jgi:hypothetical protein
MRATLVLSSVLSCVLSASLALTGLPAHAVTISAEQVAESEGITSGAAQRERLLAALEREDVARVLAERGVDLDQARLRVAALSDAEAARLGAEIDRAPAGANDVVGSLIFVLVLLLITDILGYTKVFPFTRPIR